ncbi:hypothetical protein NIES4106_31220 [Fischerella sp. NIES-4106]|nr:hypothetical protein NIES4106_31220 [Fischerella sp. NIES-4106]
MELIYQQSIKHKFYAILVQELLHTTNKWKLYLVVPRF